MENLPSPKDWTANQKAIYAKIQAEHCCKARREGNEAAKETPADVIKAKRKALTKSIALKAAREGATLEATTPSTCFASVSWDGDGDPADGMDMDGTCTLEFHRGELSRISWN